MGRVTLSFRLCVLCQASGFFVAFWVVAVVLVVGCLLVAAAVSLWISSPPRSCGLRLVGVMRSLTGSVVGGPGPGCPTGTVRNSFLLLCLVGGVAAQCGVSGLTI